MTASGCPELRCAVPRLMMIVFGCLASDQDVKYDEKSELWSFGLYWTCAKPSPPSSPSLPLPPLLHDPSIRPDKATSSITSTPQASPILVHEDSSLPGWYRIRPIVLNLGPTSFALVVPRMISDLTKDSRGAGFAPVFFHHGHHRSCRMATDGTHSFASCEPTEVHLHAQPRLLVVLVLVLVLVLILLIVIAIVGVVATCGSVACLFVPIDRSFVLIHFIVVPIDCCFPKSSTSSRISSAS